VAIRSVFDSFPTKKNFFSRASFIIKTKKKNFSFRRFHWLSGAFTARDEKKRRQAFLPAALYSRQNLRRHTATGAFIGGSGS
jgi:hypothetical protein